MTVIPIVSGDIDEQTVVAVFSTIEQAQAAVDALHRAAEPFKGKSYEERWRYEWMEFVGVQDPIPFNPTIEDLLKDANLPPPAAAVFPEPR